jgi:hypothetical protein
MSKTKFTFYGQISSIDLIGFRERDMLKPIKLLHLLYLNKRQTNRISQINEHNLTIESKFFFLAYFKDL